jgi:uncharacterized cupredoxin-like copper-binding protein
MKTIGTFAFMASALLGACTKEAPKTDTTAVAQASASAPATAAGSYDPATRVATIISKDFAFLAPDSIAAGWTTFRLVNDGGTIHHLQLVRLDSGKTAADVAAALKNPGPPPKWMIDAGGASAADPKTESNATLNLEPGNYAMLCFVDAPDHVMHFTKGMVHALKVTASTAMGAAPTADLTIALSDYAFTVQGAGALTAGKHTIKIVNDGPQGHEIQLIRLATGKTMKDLAAWVQKYEGPPPASAIDGYFTVELAPGNYAFACFAPDTKDGKSHLEHGMVKEFTVN